MAKVVWSPMDPKAWNEKVVRRAVPGLRKATHREAEVIASRARPVLMAHHIHNMERRYKNLSADDKAKLAHSYIEVSRGTVDAFVSLNDPEKAAAAIEKNLNILKGAMGGI